MKKQWKALWQDESGEFGIKQIAITVAVIVLIGAIIAVVRGNLSGWIDEIWKMFTDLIDNLTN